MDKEGGDFIDRMGKLIEKLKPFMAILFLVFAIIGIINLAQYVKHQPEIKKMCGWEDEAVKCFCEKDIYYEKKNAYDQGVEDFSDSNNSSFQFG